MKRFVGKPLLRLLCGLLALLLPFCALAQSPGDGSWQDRWVLRYRRKGTAPSGGN